MTVRALKDLVSDLLSPDFGDFGVKQIMPALGDTLDGLESRLHSLLDAAIESSEKGYDEDEIPPLKNDLNQLLAPKVVTQATTKIMSVAAGTSLGQAAADFALVLSSLTDDAVKNIATSNIAVVLDGAGKKSAKKPTKKPVADAEDDKSWANKVKAAPAPKPAPTPRPQVWQPAPSTSSGGKGWSSSVSSSRSGGK